MQQIIPIGKSDFAGCPKQTVNARELHAFLEVCRTKPRMAEFCDHVEQLFNNHPDLRFYQVGNDNEKVLIAVDGNTIFIYAPSSSRLKIIMPEIYFISIHELMDIAMRMGIHLFYEQREIARLIDKILINCGKFLNPYVYQPFIIASEYLMLTNSERFKEVTSEKVLSNTFKYNLENNKYEGLKPCRVKVETNQKHIPDGFAVYKDEIVPIEMKASKFDDKAQKQLRRYMKEYGCSYGIAVARELTTNLDNNIVFIPVEFDEIKEFLRAKSQEGGVGG